MILTVFLNFIALVLTGFIDLLPTIPMPTAWVNAVYQIWSFGNSFSYVFPVATLLQAFLLVLSFEIAVMVFKFFNWLIRKIPGVS